MKIKTFLAVLMIALVVNGCKKSSKETPAPVTATPGANEVFIQNSAFSPASITVAVNTTITWTNKDNLSHTVTSNTGAFDSGLIGVSGGTYSHQFTTAGTFVYHCAVHSGMTGTVVVQ